MPRTFQIRNQLLPRDRDAIASILVDAAVFRAEEVAVGLEIVDESLAPGPSTDYEWRLANSDAEAGELLGFACFGPVPLTDGTFDLYWIAVAPSARGSAVAVELERSVSESVAGRGGRWLLAETSSTPPYAPARRFYLKAGYSLLETIPDFYRPGDDRLTYGKRFGGPPG